jgi:hypothetical protein
VPDLFKPAFHDPFDSALAEIGKQELHRTLGEFFPDGSSIDLLYKRQSDRLELVQFTRKQVKIETIISIGDRDYAVAPVHSSFVRSIVWPERVEKSYGTTADLFWGIRSVFIKHGFSEDVSRVAAYFVIATWFPELVPIAPCFTIAGPHAECDYLLDILGCLVRRPLQPGELDRSILACVPFTIRPTLLVGRQPAGRKAQELLLLSSRRECWLPRGNALVNASYAKAVYCGVELMCGSLGDSLLPVQLTPIPDQVHVLSRRRKQELAEYFQPKLIAYRAANHIAVGESEFDLPGLTPDSRILARALGACIVDAPELQDGLREILESRDAIVSAERFSDLKCLVIEALLEFCHTRPEGKVYVREISRAVLEIGEWLGESRSIEARKVGHVLRALGFVPERDTLGYAIALPLQIQRRVHALAREFSLPKLNQSDFVCGLCDEAFTVSEETDRAGPGKMPPTPE